MACPKCGEPFVIRVDDDDTAETPKLPGRRRRPNRSPVGQRKVPKEPEEALGFGFASLFSTLIWLNAHVAVVWCIVDNVIDFGWLVMHFNEVLQQSGLGRLAARRIGRPVLVAISAGMIWYQSVLPRDTGTRALAVVFGGGYLFLFGGVAFVIGMMATSLYERPVYAIQWSVVYLGVSLLAFAVWGFGPETPVQRAERLMSNGHFDKALAIVRTELEKDEDNIAAIRLEKTLRDVVRVG